MLEEARKKIEEKLQELPIVQYAWLTPEDIPFSKRVRSICREECPRYGTSWSCPPGVGSVEECCERCKSYDGVFVFTTVAEVADAANMEETLATRGAHEETTRQIREIFCEHSFDTTALSGESCAICKTCTYPDAPCRHTDQMLPCIEGYGIVVPLLAEEAGIEFMNGGNIVTWFGLVLYRRT